MLYNRGTDFTALGMLCLWYEYAGITYVASNRVCIYINAHELVLENINVIE